MSHMRHVLLLLAVAALGAVAAGCGGSSSGTTTTAASPPATTTTATSTSTPSATTTAAGSASPSPLQAEATAAATGDIPDNQVFLHFANTTAGYSMKYPEGWAQQGSGSTATLRDKNNIIRIVVAPGGPVTAAEASKDVFGVSGAKITSPPQTITIGGKPAVKIVYTTESAPSPVTGKRLTLVVDRYYLWNAGKRAVVDLGTPQGVDNVDAYRLMIESFRWS
jgi:hypothetical protein